MDNKLNVIFDLDNTLIHSVDKNKIPSTTYINLFNYKDLEPYFRVYCRPYALEVLDVCFSEYNVHVWSAGTKDYVDFIVKNILLNPNIPRLTNIKNIKRKFHTILSREDCNIKGYAGTKNMNYLFENKKFGGKFNANNTVLIDDLVDTYNINSCCVINILGFNVFKEIEKLKDKNVSEIIDQCLLGVVLLLDNYKNNNQKSVAMCNVE